MPLSRNLLLSALAFAAVATIAPAAPPSTKSTAETPATSSSVDAKRVAEFYRQLGALNPVDRNNARVELMGLSLSDLTILRETASASQPMSPSQALALRDIVIHVYVASQTLSATEPAAFLGLESSGGGFDSIAVSDPAYPDDPTKTIFGTSFKSRKPGFCAFRYLQDGDVILSCEDVDNGPGQVISLEGFVKMKTIIGSMAPGTNIRMRVLRGGSVVTLSFRLDARPAETAGLPEVERAADVYWRENFLQLINPDFT
jgi:hypothetical protein